MKVSVIVPIYNVEDYLARCLDSILNQTLKDIEIIAVDDGSTDRSGQIVDQYAAQYPSIVVCHKKNGGLSDARNYGMKFASGEFISFVDSDDYIDKTMLEKMYQKAMNHQLDIVVCDTMMQYSDHAFPLASNLHYTNDLVRAYIFAHPMACTRLVRKQIMDQFSFEQGIYYEDLNVTPTYVIATHKIGFIEEPLYHYVQREESIMNQQRFHDKLLDIFKVTAHVKAVFAQHDLLEEYNDEIEYLYLIHLMRSATLRFLQYEQTEDQLKHIKEIMKLEFPHWRDNPYFKQSNMKFKLVCHLADRSQYRLLRLLQHLQR